MCILCDRGITVDAWGQHRDADGNIIGYCDDYIPEPEPVYDAFGPSDFWES